MYFYPKRSTILNVISKDVVYRTDQVRDTKFVPLTISHVFRAYKRKGTNLEKLRDIATYKKSFLKSAMLVADLKPATAIGTFDLGRFEYEIYHCIRSLDLEAQSLSIKTLHISVKDKTIITALLGYGFSLQDGANSTLAELQVC